MTRDFPWPLAARLFGYTALVAATTHVVVLLGAAEGGHGFTVDDSSLEWLQFSLALLAGMVFVAVGRAREDLGAVVAALGAACIMAAMREIDEFTADYVFDKAYWIPGGACALWAAAALRRSAGAWRDQAARIARSPAFLLAWSGFLVIAVFAQVFGQKQLWQAVMETTELPYRTAKNMAEEGIEVLGYILLVCAAIETCWTERPGSPE
jgi:hypothetical protein